MLKNKPLPVQYIVLNNEIKKDSKKYPFNIPFIKNFKKFMFNMPVTFIVGENGTGKSTLLEAIAVSYGFNPEGGAKNFNFNTKNTHSELYKYFRIGKSFNSVNDGYFLRGESFYNLASNIDKLVEEGGGSLYNSYGGKSLHNQSHGESFLSLMNNRLRGNGLYIFDEPETALSPMKILNLLIIIDDLVKNNSQFIISTHSPILMSYQKAEIHEIKNDRLILTEYEETSHFEITKYFMLNYKKMINDLGIE